jgi:hypothetical protein
MLKLQKTRSAQNEKHVARICSKKMSFSKEFLFASATTYNTPLHSMEKQR